MGKPSKDVWEAHQAYLGGPSSEFGKPVKHIWEAPEGYLGSPIRIILEARLGYFGKPSMDVREAWRAHLAAWHGNLGSLVEIFRKPNMHIWMVHQGYLGGHQKYLGGPVRIFGKAKQVYLGKPNKDISEAKHGYLGRPITGSWGGLAKIFGKHTKHNWEA